MTPAPLELLLVFLPVIALAAAGAVAVVRAVTRPRNRRRLRAMTEGEVALRQRPHGDVRTSRDIEWGTAWDR